MYVEGIHFSTVYLKSTLCAEYDHLRHVHAKYASDAQYPQGESIA